jgi:hypothetical protein
VCCLHRLLPGNGFQRCHLLPCSRPWRLATVSHLTYCFNCLLLAIISYHWQSNFDFRAMSLYSLTAWLQNCCWPSPAQWLFVPSPTGLIAIFYSLTALESFRPLTPVSTHWLSESESLYDWRSVGQCVLVSSPIWVSWPDINYCFTVTVLSISDAPYDERSGLPKVKVKVTLLPTITKNTVEFIVDI